MIDIDVSEEQKSYAENTVNRYNFGMRGYGDGNRNEQLTGIIGQTVLADLLGQSRPDGESGFDNGVDFIINNRKADLKTMSRTVPVKDHYVHNFIGYQIDYDVDFYIFASYNKSNDVLSICGFLSKNDFLKKAKYYKKGEMRFRDDGSSFPSKAPLYEIRQSDLNQADTLQKLMESIN